MFWCMPQPSTPAPLPPHRLRRTTLPSLPLPACLPAQAHNDTVASTPAVGAPAFLVGEGRALEGSACSLLLVRVYTHSHTHMLTGMWTISHTPALTGHGEQVYLLCRESKTMLAGLLGLLSLNLCFSLHLSRPSPFLLSLCLCLSPALSVCRSPCHRPPPLHACCSWHILLGKSPTPGSPGQPLKHVPTCCSPAHSL